MDIETKYIDLGSYAQSIDDIIEKYVKEATTTTDVATYHKVLGDKALDRRVHSKNSTLRKKLMKKPISEAKSITVSEIIFSLGGEAFFKKSFKTHHAARTYVINNLKKIMDTFGISQKDLPMASLDSKLKELIGSK